MTRRRLLTREDLIELLVLVAAEACRRDVQIEMFLVGGGAMALAYNTSRVTGDLDGVGNDQQQPETDPTQHHATTWR